jgi:hypothetical protein
MTETEEATERAAEAELIRLEEAASGAIDYIPTAITTEVTGLSAVELLAALKTIAAEVDYPETVVMAWVLVTSSLQCYGPPVGEELLGLLGYVATQRTGGRRAPANRRPSR